MESHVNVRLHKCQRCSFTTKHFRNLKRHKKTAHGLQKFSCHICKISFTRRDSLARHILRHKAFYGESSTSDELCEGTALRGSFRVKIIKPEEIYRDPTSFIENKYVGIKNILSEALDKTGALKWYIVLTVKMSKKVEDTEVIAEPHFRGKCHIALNSDGIDEDLEDSAKKIHTSFNDYQAEGSSWTVDNVVGLSIHMAKYNPVRGSSYIPLPTHLARKQAIINVKNSDNRCFLWAILSALHPQKRAAQRVTKYAQYSNTLDFSNIQFPVKLDQVKVFERLNNISITIFGYEKDNVYPLYIPKQKHSQHVNLLLLSNKTTSHYCWIKSLSRLLYDLRSHKARYHHCPYCLQGFTKEIILQRHEEYCMSHNPQRIDLPSEDNKWLGFSDVRKQLKVPFVVYADFECLQVPIAGCANNHDKSYTEKYTKHVPCGFAYKVIGLTKESSGELICYRGLDAVDKFVNSMITVQDRIEKKLKICEPMQLTGRDWQSFKHATHCTICEKELLDDRCRDHCHITGRFRSAVHKKCNLNYKFTRRIPVVFHNLKGYDRHLIMQAIGKIKDRKLTCIPNNMEKYISFSLGCMDFIDSIQFMPQSLEKLMNNLTRDKFNHMSEYFGVDRLDLLLRKQVYPYEYFNSADRFLETSLPPMSAFHSSLTGEDISDEDYKHVQNVWDQFKLHDLGDYHDLYVKTDVLGLADVFENFREMCLGYYQLDACHFYTSPGLAWQAALKMTGVQLELLTDIDIHLFIEQGIRGGMSMISHRYAKANNTYTKEYDESEPDSHILYLDANNLYGWAMSEPLPISHFRWLIESELSTFDGSLIPDDAEQGYKLEVDLEYPKELHDGHNDYPLAPEKLKISKEMLSPYAESLLSDLNLSGTVTEKLGASLLKKRKYILHYRNLKLYLSLGMKLTRIHRVLEFKQHRWLKSYIDFNTEKRKCAKNDFEKDFFKLMNNSVFGKTMENLRNRMDVKLINNEEKAIKLTSKPSFQAFRIFNADLVAIHMLKVRLLLNRPIYVGFAILDVSKTLMYDFHYRYMKRKYGCKAKLLFTDTDSLCYHVETKDIYKDMSQESHLFDTSEYKDDHPLYSTVNKKVLGKMKDETKGCPILEFVGLKSKMYSFLYMDEHLVVKDKKTAKGVKKAVVKKNIKHDNYKQCLFQRKPQIYTMTHIRSYGHQLYNVILNKLGLSPLDDKRYIMTDGVSSLAYGHWRIDDNNIFQ